MKVTLIHLAAMFCMYGRPTHGLSSASNHVIASRDALHLLRWYFTTDTKPCLFFFLERTHES